MDDLTIPGRTYIGKNGTKRILVDRVDMDGQQSEQGMTLRWKKPDSSHLRTCWISTWLEWVKAVAE